MDGGEPHSAGDDTDDFVAEVSDLRSRQGVAAPPSTRGLFVPLTRRQRNVRLVALLCSILLALTVVMGAFPGLRTQALGLIPGLVKTPTPPLALGADLFYLLPNPPGVVVTLDGRVVAPMPTPENGAPLRLARGAHVFRWRSDQYPLKPLSCRVSVPHAPTDSCPLVSRELLPVGLANLRGNVIGMHESLGALDSDPAAARLPTAIQLVLDTLRSTAIIQPGERYFVAQPGQSGAAVVATQPLRAIRTVQFFDDPSFPEPCILDQPAVPCRFIGQDCGQLCTILGVPRIPAVIGPPGTWMVAATVHTVWSYETLGGQVVAQDIPEPITVQLAVLRITWDGAGWHVAPLTGHVPGFDIADDAACDSARFAISQTASWSFMVENPPPGATAQFASDTTLSDGCVAVLNQGGPAVFLERFGVLLTVNDAAVNPTDNLSVADAAERQLAQRLMASLSP